MTQSRNRRRSFGPYGCFLFLLGIGFLIAGFSSGMVPKAIVDIVYQKPESADAFSALGTWGFITIGSFTLGSLGIRRYGLRKSTMWLGIILILCGAAGLFVNFTGGEASYSGNPIWIAMNFVADIGGSLLAVSVAAVVGGGLLVLGMLLIGEKQEPKYQSSGGGFTGYGFSQNFQSNVPGQITTCTPCGHLNPAWRASCEKCGVHLSMGKL
jgi:hypothetical protein